MPKGSLAVIGHRGDGVGPDENTLPSFHRAIRHGADGLEIDVQLYRNRLVCAHDHASEHSPLLADVLPELSVPLVLHVKRRRFRRVHDRAVIDRLADVLKSGRRDVTISSFWPGTIRYLKRHYPELRSAFATWVPDYDLFWAKHVRADEYHGWYRLMTKRAAARAHRSGLRLIAYARPFERPSVSAIRALGVDGIITDRIRQFAESR